MIDTSAISTRAVWKRVSTADTTSLLLATSLTVVALLLGLVLRNSVESRTRSYKDATFNATIYYPDTWQLNNTTPGVISVRDTHAPGFPTTFELHRTAVDPAATDTAAVSTVANGLAGTRAGKATGFKLFNITPRESIKGLPAAKASYVYVDIPSGAFQQGLPAVVLGTDYLVRKAGAVYTFSMLSTDANHGAAQPLFDQFVQSAELP